MSKRLRYVAPGVVRVGIHLCLTELPQFKVATDLNDDYHCRLLFARIFLTDITPPTYGPRQIKVTMIHPVV